MFSGGSNLVTERPIKLGAYLSSRKEMILSGFEPAPNPPGRTLYTLSYCPYMHLHFGSILYSHAFTFICIYTLAYICAATIIEDRSICELK